MIQLKQHDTARKIIDRLTIDDVDIDLTGASVVLIFRNALGDVTRRSATITSPTLGKVEYQPVDADVAVAGNFDLEWEITFSDDTQLSVPTSGYGQLRINADLD